MRGHIEAGLAVKTDAPRRPCGKWPIKDLNCPDVP
jgi:hypothetical protein